MMHVSSTYHVVTEPGKERWWSSRCPVPTCCYRARQRKVVEFQMLSTYLLLQSQAKKGGGVPGAQYQPVVTEPGKERWWSSRCSVSTCCYRVRQRKMVEFQVSITYQLLQNQAKKAGGVPGVQYLLVVTEPGKERW